MAEIKNLDNKPEKELNNLLEDKRDELLELRSENEMGHLKESHKLKQVRKDIARILTALNQN